MLILQARSLSLAPFRSNSESNSEHAVSALSTARPRLLYAASVSSSDLCSVSASELASLHDLSLALLLSNGSLISLRLRSLPTARTPSPPLPLSLSSLGAARERSALTSARAECALSLRQLRAWVRERMRLSRSFALPLVRFSAELVRPEPSAPRTHRGEGLSFAERSWLRTLLGTPRTLAELMALSRHTKYLQRSEAQWTAILGALRGTQLVTSASGLALYYLSPLTTRPRPKLRALWSEWRSALRVRRRADSALTPTLTPTLSPTRPLPRSSSATVQLPTLKRTPTPPTATVTPPRTSTPTPTPTPTPTVAMGPPPPRRPSMSTPPSLPQVASASSARRGRRFSQGF